MAGWFESFPPALESGGNACEIGQVGETQLAQDGVAVASGPDPHHPTVVGVGDAADEPDGRGPVEWRHRGTPRRAAAPLVGLT
jgi:hypothetical protein